MKVLLDINVVLDFLLEREPFFEDVKKIFVVVETKKIEGYLCASSIDTIYYLVSEALGKREAQKIIYKLLKIFDITEVNKTTILEALNSNFSDFEDSIIYSSAYLNNIDYIISRDKKGFKNSKIEVLNPAEFVVRLF